MRILIETGEIRPVECSNKTYTLCQFRNIHHVLMCVPADSYS